MLQIKRIYEAPAKTDGYRVLVDRLWPRGVSKAEAALNAWLKEIAPSTELREWFGHKPERFAAFRKKYRAELAQNPVAAILRDFMAQHSTVTILYGAKDPNINHAVVLKEFLNK